MPVKNAATEYGLAAILLHWTIAVAVTGLFALGLWIGDLDYYDAWYQRAPALHKGLGVLLFILVVVRLLWRQLNMQPAPEPTHSVRERWLARLTHLSLHLLLVGTMLAGYLISTADGRPVDVFGLFQLPATLSGIDRQEDIAGEVHELLAFALIGLTVLHAAAALKHHFIDRDRTLKRMLGI